MAEPFFSLSINSIRCLRMIEAGRNSLSEEQRVVAMLFSIKNESRTLFASATWLEFGTQVERASNLSQISQILSQKLSDGNFYVQ